MEIKVIAPDATTTVSRSIMERRHVTYIAPILSGRSSRSVALTEDPDGVEGPSMDCQVLSGRRCSYHPFTCPAVFITGAPMARVQPTY